MECFKMVEKIDILVDKNVLQLLNIRDALKEVKVML